MVPDKRFDEMIAYKARNNCILYSLLYSIIKVESNFDPYTAKSSNGEIDYNNYYHISRVGLGGIAYNSSLFKELNINLPTFYHLFNPEINLEICAKILRKIITEANDPIIDVDKVIRKYKEVNSLTQQSDEFINNYVKEVKEQMAKCNKVTVLAS